MRYQNDSEQEEPGDFNKLWDSFPAVLNFQNKDCEMHLKKL